MLEKFRSKLKRKVRGQKHGDEVATSSTNNESDAGTNADSDTTSIRAADTETPQEQNLWVVAGERLDEKYRIALDLESAIPVTDSIDDVIKTTEEKYREYQEGGLKIRKRGGGQINVRDSAKNIILYTLQAQDLVKKLASFDPTGHASSAWSVVSIGLTLIKNDIERRDDIFEASEYLARILSYYALVESGYRKRGVESDRGLEDALVEVYAAVLQYVAEVKMAVHESKAARVLKSITALVEQPFKDLKEIIETKEMAVQALASLTADLDNRKKAESMLDKIDETVERLKIIQSHTRSLQDREILDWLSNTCYSDTQNNTQTRRASDTGDWFLKSPVYTNWKATPGKVCWGYGAVGCGKSVLCSTVIQDIETLCASDPSKRFAYWYFQFSNDETQKLYNMTRSILRQLMPRTLPGSLFRLWEDHSHRGSNPQLQRFTDILDIVLEDSEDESFLIIDAMDECPTTEHDGRRSLLEFMEQLSRKHPSKLHIFATSRPESDIRSVLEQYESVDLEIGLGGDVETFVRDQISHGRLSEWDESVKEKTLKRLLDIPERRFRWADLQIKELQKSKSTAAFHKALDTIPVTLEETYQGILERLSADDREAARTILIWLSFSIVPLSLKTVAAVVSFRFPDDVVKTCTSSLVTVSISDDTVRLAHFSVKEFLVCDFETHDSWFRFSASSGHLAMAHKTIDSLLEATEVLTKKTAGEQPLLIYSARYWDSHLAELAEAYANHTDLDQKVYCLFNDNDVYLNWMHLVKFGLDYVWHQSFEEVTPPLTSASEMGLEATVRRLLSESTNPRLMIKGQNWRRNAILGAASKGHLNILELLLNKVEEIPRDAVRYLMRWFKVTEASQKKLPTIIELLWNKGCLQDQLRSSERVIDEEFVSAAVGSIGNGSGYLFVKEFLKQKERFGIRKNRQLLCRMLVGSFGGSWDTELMDLLFNEFDTDIKFTQSQLKGIASSIARLEDSKIAIAILNRWMNDVELSEKLIGRISRGKREVMEFLLQKPRNRARVTQKVLMQAIKWEADPETISLLIEKRDPETTIKKDILLATAKRSSKGREVVEILLDACGSDTAIDDELLQEVAKNRDEGLGMMKLLLRRQQAGFVVTSQTFCNAARNNSQAMLELLVDNASGSDLAITEETLVAVANNIWHGESLIKYLFDLKGYDLPISEDLVSSIAKINDFSAADTVLAFVLDKWTDILVSDQLLEAACLHPNTLNMLLDRRNDTLPIRKMAQKAATNRGRGKHPLEILLDRKLVEVDEWLIEAAAGNSNALEVIYERDPQFLVTPKIVIAAARDVGAMRILLDRQKDAIRVTEDVIKAAWSGLYPVSVINLLLLRLGPNKVPITEDTLILAIQKNQVGGLRLLLEHDHNYNLNAVWEAMWQDPEVKPATLAEASTILLEYHTFCIDERMLERTPAEAEGTVRFGGRYLFDEFIRSCMRRRAPLPITEPVMMLVVEKSSLDTIEIFLENHPDIRITDKHIEAARRNPIIEDIDMDALMSLLNAKLASAA